MEKPPFIPYKDKRPDLHKNVFVAPGAKLIGNLTVGEMSSIWFNVVIRADINYIKIGKRTNVQDGTVIHVTGETGPVNIGDNVTIGHNAVIHGCTIEDDCLIGMGAIVLDNAIIRKGSFVAAGALVPPGKDYPPSSLIKGAPAKLARELEPKDLAEIKEAAKHYIEMAENYIKGCP